jgi:hypothetical protein
VGPMLFEYTLRDEVVWFTAFGKGARQDAC